MISPFEAAGFNKEQCVLLEKLVENFEITELQIIAALRGFEAVRKLELIMKEGGIE